MKKFLPFLILLLLMSCGETPKVNSSPVKTNPTPVTPKTDIGKTGFAILLSPGYKMEEKKGPDYSVFYINPVDTANGKGEAGIYFGPSPDQSGPKSALSQNIDEGMVLGKKAHITTYATPTYTWVETIIDENDSLKIQYWYYGYNETEMIGLNKMMSSISRK
jgi:hypothetical protein